jgi:hypothetical protein
MGALIIDSRFRSDAHHWQGKDVDCHGGSRQEDGSRPEGEARKGEETSTLQCIHQDDCDYLRGREGREKARSGHSGGEIVSISDSVKSPVTALQEALAFAEKIPKGSVAVETASMAQVNSAVVQAQELGRKDREEVRRNALKVKVKAVMAAQRLANEAMSKRLKEGAAAYAADGADEEE